MTSTPPCASVACRRCLKQAAEVGLNAAARLAGQPDLHAPFVGQQGRSGIAEEVALIAQGGQQRSRSGNEGLFLGQHQHGGSAQDGEPLAPGFSPAACRWRASAMLLRSPGSTPGFSGS
jgi:hypothetical protein